MKQVRKGMGKSQKSKEERKGFREKSGSIGKLGVELKKEKEKRKKRKKRKVREGE